MPQQKLLRRKLKDLNLLDDFLFGTIVGHPVWGEPFSRILLETVFQKKFGKLKIVPQKTYYGKDTDLHGARFDVYLETKLDENDAVQTTVYDMEPDQKPGTLTELSRRDRFYHAVVDSECLQSGANYQFLKNVVIIFIMPKDPCGLGRMVYTISRMCKEAPELPYDDGSQTIYLYTKGTEGNPPEALRQLLHYMEESTEENAVNRNLKELHRMVEATKQDREVELSYMKSWDREMRLRREGREEEQRNTERERQRADQAEARANQAEVRADQAEVRADQAEAKIRSLEAELRKYTQKA